MPALRLLENVSRSGPNGLLAEVSDLGEPTGSLGDFRILREVGRGGMGVVYEAEQISLRRRVALKVLPFAATMDSRQLQRFQNEARAAASLEHPHIVPVFGVGCERSVHYYAMKFIDGQSLADVIRRLRIEEGMEDGKSRIENWGPRRESRYGEFKEDRDLDPCLREMGTGLPTPHQPRDTGLPEGQPNQAAPTIQDRQASRETVACQFPSSIFNPRSLNFYRQIAEWTNEAATALEYAHQMGIIHRDIKPSNLLIETTSLHSVRGRVDEGEGAYSSRLTHHSSLKLWITDFGLAKTASDVGLTMTGDLLGTLRYMSPEQALAKRALVDHRSDVYALGVTLYEALTLQPAYVGSDREELLQQIAAGEPPPPRRLLPSIPIELETISLKAMAREPEGRYQTAQEMANDLRRFLEGRPILARRPSLGERAVRWSRRHRTVLGASLAVLLLAFAGLLAALIILWNEQARTKAALKETMESKEEVQKQRQLAEANFDRALRGATEMLMKLDPPLGDAPHIDPALRKKIIDRGLSFFQAFIDEENPDPAERFQSSKAYEQIACVHCSQHDAADCRAAMEKSFALLERLTADFPDRDLYRRELIRERYLMGLFYKSLGHRRDAQEQYQCTVQLCRLTAELDVSAETMNTCSWILVDCPDETLRDAGLAVALAEKAVTADPEQAKYWNTLGIACYRKGDWTKARSSLEQSMNLSDGGNGYDWVFLAMTCQRLGDVEDAQVWRNKAVSWLEMQEGKPENMLRYRAEADALLGLVPGK
jgi:serine/threonine protein kinase